MSTFRALVDAPPEAAAAEPPKRLKRDELDRRTHAVDASGRVLRDNVWGEQHEDAARRDFTINAMYYDPSTQTVLDYHDGMADVRARLLRMIGDPATRFREDPVRMLRVVRFAAKLGFEIEPHTREPINALADLINNVPAARLFDEMLKLLLSGHALACLQRLRKEGLHHGLLPLLDVVLEQPQGEVHHARAEQHRCTRARRQDGITRLPVRDAAVARHAPALRAIHGRRRNPGAGAPSRDGRRARHADRETRDPQALLGRHARDLGPAAASRETLGRSAMRLLEHQRFRAGYDFLLLRCESGGFDTEVGQWWTDFIEGDAAAREALLTQGGTKEKSPRKRRRRGGVRNRKPGEGAAEQAPDAPGGSDD